MDSSRPRRTEPAGRRHPAPSTLLWLWALGVLTPAVLLVVFVPGQARTASSSGYAGAAALAPAAAPPVLSSLSPSSAAANSGGFALIVSGTGFLDSAVVLWNQSPRSTTISSRAQLVATISASDLVTTEQLTTVAVTVDNGDGSGPSASLPFLITGSDVGATQTSAVPPGGTGTVNLPPAPGTGGVVATLTQGPSDPAATLIGATYTTNPTPVPISGQGISFYDLRVLGGGAQSAVVVTFTYTPVAGAAPVLRFFDPRSGRFQPVRGSTLVPNSYIVNTAQHTITVTLDATSFPTLGALGGTVFVTGSVVAPVAAGDAYSTPVDTSLMVAAPGVLANDTQADGDPLVAVLVSATVHGALTLNADGSFAYAPNSGFTGGDGFTYQAKDSLSGATSNTVAVTITVVPAAGTPTPTPTAAPTSPPTPAPTPTPTPSPAPPTPAPSLPPAPLGVGLFGSVTVTVSGCGSVSPAGTTFYGFGATAYVTATPCDNAHVFTGWTGGGPGCDGFTFNPCTIAVPPFGIVVTAHFAPAR